MSGQHRSLRNALATVCLLACLGTFAGLSANADGAPVAGARPTCELASVRSSASGVITAVLKKCGPGLLTVRTTPSYVALAETRSLTLITLDRRLAKAPGANCQIAVP